MASTHPPAGSPPVLGPESGPTPGEAPAAGAPRLVMLGMPCAGTVAAVATLRAAGVRLAALVLADPAGQDQGFGRGAPGWPGEAPADQMLTLPRLDALARARIAALAPEVIVAACFPWRLPPALLALPPLGALNIHPSLLPRGRGPDPVFWTYRRAEATTGVTVHLMDDDFDTGPVLAQAAHPFPADGRAATLERALMAAGGRLTAALLPALAAGALTPVPQREAEATPAPFPTAPDLEMSTGEPAAAGYRFVRAVGPSHGPLTLRDPATGSSWRVVDALDFACSAPAPTAEPAAAAPDGTLHVRCGAGWVRCLLAGGGRYPLALSSLSARVKR